MVMKDKFLIYFENSIKNAEIMNNRWIANFKEYFNNMALYFLTISFVRYLVFLI